MNEEKTKKPLLSYEQVKDIIDERISREGEECCDERIIRIENAVKELETGCRKDIQQLERKKRKKNSFRRIWIKLLHRFKN